MERRWWGRLRYGDALDRQRRRREAVIRGEADEALWALEHPPVVTVGRRGGLSAGERAAILAEGIEIVEVERGGLATWHGPGQLVVYALVDCVRRGYGPRSLVHRLEEGVITWLAGEGVATRRREGHPGVWVPGPGAGTLNKICAVGLHIRRGVSIHGLALNLDPDLSAQALFRPCGIPDAGVTSLARVAGTAPSPAEAAEGVLEAVEAALQ